MTTRRPLLVVALVVVAALVACADDGPTQAEFNEAMDGVTADPATYELTVIDCTNDGEVVRYTWGLTNLGDERKTFAFDPFLTNAAGEEEQKNRQLVGESVGPGEYMEWEGRNGGGERFPIGDIDCRFEVVDSVLGQFREEG